MHLFLHARAQRRYAGKAIRNDSRRTLGKQALLNIVDNLHATIAGLRWEAGKTDWADYYLGDSYHEAGFESKQRIVSRFIDRGAPEAPLGYGREYWPLQPHRQPARHLHDID